MVNGNPKQTHVIPKQPRPIPNRDQDKIRLRFPGGRRVTMDLAALTHADHRRLRDPRTPQDQADSILARACGLSWEGLMRLSAPDYRVLMAAWERQLDKAAAGGPRYGEAEDEIRLSSGRLARIDLHALTAERARAIAQGEDGPERDESAAACVLLDGERMSGGMFAALPFMDARRVIARILHLWESFAPPAPEDFEGAAYLALEGWERAPWPVLRWQIALETGWTFDHIDAIGMADLREWVAMQAASRSAARNAEGAA